MELSAERATDVGNAASAGRDSEGEKMRACDTTI